MILMYVRCLSLYTNWLLLACSVSQPFSDPLLSVMEQCACHRLQSEGIVLEWVAFSTTKNGLKLTLDTLERFEHEVIQIRGED